MSPAMVLRLDDASIARMATEALEDLGADMEADARMRCPVDTGELRASIYHEVATGPVPTLTVGATAEHAAYVELGTSRAAAQPFLQPAVFRHR